MLVQFTLVPLQWMRCAHNNIDRSSLKLLLMHKFAEFTYAIDKALLEAFSTHAGN